MTKDEMLTLVDWIAKALSDIEIYEEHLAELQAFSKNWVFDPKSLEIGDLAFNKKALELRRLVNSDVCGGGDIFDEGLRIYQKLKNELWVAGVYDVIDELKVKVV